MNARQKSRCDASGTGSRMCALFRFAPGICLALVAWNLASAQSAEQNSRLVDHFADNGLGNAVAVVQHPAGEHYKGVTYVSYQGPLEDPYVASYNHETREWAGPFKAGVSDMGKDPDRPKAIDNHGKPTLIIDNAGYIHVFFGGHGGMPKHGKNPLGNHHYGRNKHVVTKKPLDISSWEELDTIPAFGTYNQVVKMDNGDIYLFYRHGAHRSDWVYQISTDNGRSFAPPLSFLKHKRRDDLAAVDSWYAWVGRGQGDDIIVSYDYHLCWDSDANNGRGHTTERHDAYYMVFDTKSGAWRNIAGRDLEMPITREYADKTTFAVSTGGLWTFGGSAHLDPGGRPHIGINIGEDLGEITGGPKRTTHFRWDGEGWVGGTSPVKIESRGDFIVRSEKEVSFLLAYSDDSDGVVAWWNSTDGGARFTKGDELLRRGKAKWAITSIIRNAHPDAQVVVAEKPPGTDFRNMYLLGESGPIKRKQSEATILQP